MANTCIPDIIRHEIQEAQNERQVNRYFNYYKIIMKIGMNNIYKMDYSNQTLSSEDAFNTIKQYLSDMRLSACFYGDISEEKTLAIFNEHYAININTSSIQLEIHFDKPTENVIMEYLHTQYIFEGSYILRFPKLNNDEENHLVSNYFLLGGYSFENNIKMELIKILWKGLYPFFIYNRDYYYASFDKYIYDGMMFLIFLVQGNLKQVPTDQVNGPNAVADREIKTLFNIIQKSDDDDLYWSQMTLLSKYWKNDTSLEERCDNIFNTLYLGLDSFGRRALNKDELQKNYTKDVLLDYINDIFIANPRKLSIQLYPIKTITSKEREKYEFSNMYSYVDIDNFNYVEQNHNGTVHPQL